MVDSFQSDLELFRERKLKAKEIFYIEQINKNVAYDFIKQHHYLGKAKFFSNYSFGLFYKKNNELVGCATYAPPQGISSLKGWFSLGNSTTNVLELTRLCVLPQLNGTNATSYLLGGTIKKFVGMNAEQKRRLHKLGVPFTEKDWVCRAITTLATSDRHVGSIYQVCNFKYYGLTDKKTDFYEYVNDDEFRKNPRGETKDLQGVWLNRPRKHRYAYILDNSLKCNYEELDEFPMRFIRTKVQCCHGTGVVVDCRFNKFYTCPICTGKLKKLSEEELFC